MKSIFYYINQNKIIKDILFFLFSSLSKMINVPEYVVARSKLLNETKGAEYSFGLIFWFMAYKLRLPIPKYNIYHLLNNEERAQVVEIISSRVSNYRIAKQYYLMVGETPTEEFKLYIVETIKNRIAKLGTISTQTKYFDTDRAFTCLCETADVLIEHEIRPFLISGTLLGLEREGQLLSHDNDIDLGVFQAEAGVESIANVLQSTGFFKSVYQFEHMVRATHRSGISVDIFLHYSGSDKVWHGTDVHRWYNSNFTLLEKSYLGHTFYVPSDTVRYLRENYGDEWDSPVLFWDYSFDTPNHQFSNTTKAVFFLLERILSEFDQNRPCRYQVETAMFSLKEIFGIQINGNFKKTNRQI